MSLVFGEDEFISKWVSDLIPHADDFGPCVTIGVTNDKEELIAGIVYNSYQPKYGTIELSMAAVSPMWAKKEIIAELLRYPFEQLGCYKVYTVTPAENEKALKVNAHIGFKREAILASHFGKNRHAVIMRMLLPDYLRLFGAK